MLIAGDVCYYRFSVTEQPLVYRILENVDTKHIRVKGINTSFLNGIRPVEAFVTEERAAEMVEQQAQWEELARIEFGLYSKNKPQTVEEAV